MKIYSDCCKAKVLMMFPTGEDNGDMKKQDVCSKCYKRCKIKENEQK